MNINIYDKKNTMFFRKLLKISNRKKSIILYILLSTMCSCKKFISIKDPVTSTNTTIVYSTDASACAVMTGIYSKMSSNSFYSDGNLSLSLSPELSGDNLKLYTNNNERYNSYYMNNLTPQYLGNLSNLWSQIYTLIYAANAIIEGVSNSTTLSNIVKKQLLGEAFFIRAYFNFYLVNLYGDIPIVTTTDYNINARIARSSKAEVYSKIISDLKTAEEYLSETYVDGTLVFATKDRLRPNKYAAEALLSRTYLYNQDYTNAEKYATLVINNKILYDTSAIKNVFQKNSQETIWAIQPVEFGENTKEALFYTLPPTGPDDTHPVCLSTELMNAFEPNDNRKKEWTSNITISNIEYSYPTKYKEINTGAPLTEYSIVLRLAEQYLIRSEARVQQNRFQEAKDDLNIIRKRSGLGLTVANSKEALLSAIASERRVELFTEYGQRWLDLKRLHLVNQVMSTITPLKGGIWKPSSSLYPIPQFERDRNNNLSQNAGYN